VAIWHEHTINFFLCGFIDEQLSSTLLILYFYLMGIPIFILLGSCNNGQNQNALQLFSPSVCSTLSIYEGVFCVAIKVS
jgi:hypothetical protein